MSYGGNDTSKLMFVQQHHNNCVGTRDSSGISSRLRRAIRRLLEVRPETRVPFQMPQSINLGFLSIFNKSQVSSPFEALNSTCLLRCQRDVRPVQMRLGPRAFSSISTGDPDIPSSCEVNDEPAFMPQQGHSAFFRVRASRCPLHKMQQNQGPSHIPLAEGSLLLRCLWKVGLPLQSKVGNQLSSRDNMGCTELSSR